MELTVDHNRALQYAMIDHINFPKYHINFYIKILSCNMLNFYFISCDEGRRRSGDGDDKENDNLFGG